MSQVNGKALAKWGLPVFIVLWSLWVLGDYFVHLSVYLRAIQRFGFWGYFFLMLLISLGIFGWLRWQGEKKKERKKKAAGIRIKAWGVYALYWLFTLLFVWFYGSINELFSQSPIYHLGFFFSRMILYQAALLFVLLAALAYGQFLPSGWNPKLPNASFSFVRIAFGFSLLGFLLVVLGQLNLFYFWVLLLIILPVMAWRYRALWSFLKSAFTPTIAFNKEERWQLLPAFVLFAALALTTVGSLKVFPTGFDGIAEYMWITKLMGEYKGIPPVGSAANWSVIMSLGINLFGTDTLSILIAHWAVLLVIWGLYLLGKQFMSRGGALCAVSLFLITPATMFHTLLDEKTDMGYLLFVIALLIWLIAFFREKGGGELLRLGTLSVPRAFPVWAVAGWLAGFMFGIKYLTFLVVIGLFAMYFYRKKGKYAFLGALSLALAAIFLLRLYSFSYFNFPPHVVITVVVIYLLLGAALLLYAFRKDIPLLGRMTLHFFTFLVFFTLAFSPWIVRNLNIHKEISISTLLNGQTPGAEINYDLFPLGKAPLLWPNRGDWERPGNGEWIGLQDTWPTEEGAGEEQRPFLPARLIQGEDDQIIDKAVVEIKRYLGYESGWPLYLSLPYDISMKTNIPEGRYVDITFWWYLLLPLLFLWSGNRPWWKNGIWILTLLFISGIAQMAAYGEGGQVKAYESVFDPLLSLLPEGLNSFLEGIHRAFWSFWTLVFEALGPLYPILEKMDYIGVLLGTSLLIGLGVWLGQDRIRRLPGSLKLVLSFSFAYGLFWFLFGNGVPHYGLPFFALMTLLPGYYLVKPADLFGEGHEVFSRYFMRILFGLLLSLYLLVLYTNRSNDINSNTVLFSGPFFKAHTRSYPKVKLLEEYNPFFPETIRILNSYPDAKIYRVGTFFNYFIRKSDQRVLADDQLQEFSLLQEVYDTPAEIADILYQSGFRFILYDLNTARLDKTADRKLAQKSVEFGKFLYDCGRARLLVTDNIVEDPNSTYRARGQVYEGRPDMSGKTILRGTFVLAELLPPKRE
jgi:hypothetical protein